MAAATQTKNKDFVISRAFDTPRDLMWKCFTDPERMKHWVGPQGLHRFRRENGSAGRRRLPLRHADAQWRRHVRQVRLSRDRAAGEVGLHQYVFRTRRAASPAITAARLAVGNALDLTKAPCGWLKDKYGLSWQVIPSAIRKMMTDPDATKSARAMNAFMQMKKFDLEKLTRAYEGEPS